MAMTGVSHRSLARAALALLLTCAACNATDDGPEDANGDPPNSPGSSTGGGLPASGSGGTGSTATGRAGSNGAAGRGGSQGASGSGASAGRGGSASGDGGSAGGDGGDGGQAGSAGDGSAGSSGSAGGGGMCAPCLREAIDWGNSGGLIARTDRSALDPCNTFRHTRTTLGGGGAPASACERMLPCMGSGLHGIADVNAAVMHPDVQAALAKGDVLFGRDSRPIDGQVFEITVGKNTITVGDPCTAGGGACAAIPLGVNALAQLLRAIDEEQLNLAPCAGLFD
jgi:hypothetical protein